MTSESQTESTESGPNKSTGIDKAALYGEFLKGEHRRAKQNEWKHDVERRATLKALDLEDHESADEMRIDQSKRIRANNVYLGGAKPSASPTNKLGALAKGAIAAALIGTGAGSAIGIPMAIDAVRDFLKPAPQQQRTLDDTDTATEFGLWPPK